MEKRGEFRWLAFSPVFIYQQKLRIALDFRVAIKGDPVGEDLFNLLKMIRDKHGAAEPKAEDFEPFRQYLKREHLAEFGML